MSTNSVNMSSMDDKPIATQNDFAPEEKRVTTASGETVDFSMVDEAKTLRKMDVRLIPMLALLYLLSFLDRGNIGNAKIQGMAVTLKLSADGSQYNIALTV